MSRRQPTQRRSIKSDPKEQRSLLVPSAAFPARPSSSAERRTLAEYPPDRPLPADELNVRPVRIFQPAPTTMQSAKSTSHEWRLDWDVLQGAGRWENPLMGWASSYVHPQVHLLIVRAEHVGASGLITVRRSRSSTFVTRRSLSRSARHEDQIRYQGRCSGLL